MVDGRNDNGGLRREYRESLEALRIEVRTLGNQLLLLLQDAGDAVLHGAVPPDGLRRPAVELAADADRLERTCLELLALQQPVAGDLRGIVCCLWVVEHLDECGRLVVELATDVVPREVVAALTPDVQELLGLMAAQAGVELDLALEALTEASVPIAAALRDVDDVMNGLQRDLLRAIAVQPAEGDPAAHAVRAALGARILERVGDKAVACADRVLFWLTGATPDPRVEDAVPRPR